MGIYIFGGVKIKTDFRVMDAMTKSPICISGNTTVKECANLMVENDIGSLVIMDGDKLLGIVTEWDIVKKIVAVGKDSVEQKVSNIMCTSVTTIEPDVDLFRAINMMADLNVRHLPVVHDHKFIGFLTANDVLKIEPTLFEILIQSIELREEGDKPIFGGESREIQDFGIGDDDED